MLYVSQIIGQPIFDARNDKIASIKDVLVRYGKDDYPPVIGVVAISKTELLYPEAKYFRA